MSSAEESRLAAAYAIHALLCGSPKDEEGAVQILRSAEDAARAGEREACAKLCDTDFAKQSWARWVAAAIRARGES